MEESKDLRLYREGLRGWEGPKRQIPKSCFWSASDPCRWCRYSRFECALFNEGQIKVVPRANVLILRAFFIFRQR